MPDVAAGLEVAGYQPLRRIPLTTGEVDRLVKTVSGHPYAPAIALAAYAGLSLGDLRPLTRAEVDLTAAG